MSVAYVSDILNLDKEIRFLICACRSLVNQLLLTFKDDTSFLIFLPNDRWLEHWNYFNGKSICKLCSVTLLLFIRED